MKESALHDADQPIPLTRKNMTIVPRFVFAAIFSTTILVAHAAPDCSSSRTQQQRQDEETIVRIEREWLEAEYRGNEEFLDCLLVTGYEVMIPKDHVKHGKADLLERILKNKGKTGPIPTLDTMATVDGDNATAFSLMHSKKSNGEPLEISFVDLYVFKDGVWRAVGGVDLGN